MLGCFTFRSTATSFSMRCSWKDNGTNNSSSYATVCSSTQDLHWAIMLIKKMLHCWLNLNRCQGCVIQCVSLSACESVQIIWVRWWIKHYPPNLTVRNERIRDTQAILCCVWVLIMHCGALAYDPFLTCVYESLRNTKKQTKREIVREKKLSETFPLHLALSMIFSANSFPVDLNRNNAIRDSSKNSTDAAVGSCNLNQVLTGEPQFKSAKAQPQSYWSGMLDNKQEYSGSTRIWENSNLNSLLFC